MQCPNALRVEAELKAAYLHAADAEVAPFVEPPPPAPAVAAAPAVPASDAKPDLEYGSLSSLIPDLEDDEDVVVRRESGRQKQVAQVLCVLVSFAVVVGAYALVVAFSQVRDAMSDPNREKIFALADGSDAAAAPHDPTAPSIISQ